MQEKKNVATVKPKKKRFPIFQQKKKVHRKKKTARRVQDKHARSSGPK